MMGKPLTKTSLKDNAAAACSSKDPDSGLSSNETTLTPFPRFKLSFVTISPGHSSSSSLLCAANSFALVASLGMCFSPTSVHLPRDSGPKLRASKAATPGFVPMPILPLAALRDLMRRGCSASLLLPARLALGIAARTITISMHACKRCHGLLLRDLNLVLRVDMRGRGLRDLGERTLLATLRLGIDGLSQSQSKRERNGTMQRHRCRAAGCAHKSDAPPLPWPKASPASL
mmetsp:Transcript_148069/g.369142  ORF Transcript_148069/g.369142 Transcript_148069/m.369142 type:complete len:231 (-) Transcript_148069:20-712(-)